MDIILFTQIFGGYYTMHPIILFFMTSLWYINFNFNPYFLYMCFSHSFK